MGLWGLARSMLVPGLMVQCGGKTIDLRKGAVANRFGM